MIRYKRSNVMIHFHNNIDAQIHNNYTDVIVIIDEYYPNFKATIFAKTDLMFTGTGYKYLPEENIFGASHQLKIIKVGCKIAISDDSKIIHKKNRYPITDITMEINGNKIHKNVLHSCDSYIIRIDSNNENGRAWTVNELNYNIII